MATLVLIDYMGGTMAPADLYENPPQLLGQHYNSDHEYRNLWEGHSISFEK